MKKSKKAFLLILLLGLLGLPQNSQATLLIDEPFEGPNSVTTESGTYTNFVTSSFTGTSGHYVKKDTSIKHGGNASAEFYPDEAGYAWTCPNPTNWVQTSELWSNFFAQQDELWITYWERLSDNYWIDEGHKWFLVQLTGGGYADPYLSLQANSKTTQKLTLQSHWYSDGIGEPCSSLVNIYGIVYPGNTWVKWKYHIKLNSVTGSTPNYDGVLESWLDKGAGYQKVDTMVDYQGHGCGDGRDWTTDHALVMRGNASAKMHQIRLVGTRSKDCTIYKSYGTRWMDDIKVGTAEADVDTVSNPICPDGSCNGNETCTSCPQDCGTCDTQKPTVTDFSVPSTSNSLTVPVSTFTATDNIGVTGYLITESSTTPDINDPYWSTTPLTSYQFFSEGSKTLYAWAKDAAGNISTSRSASVTVNIPPGTNVTIGETNILAQDEYQSGNMLMAQSATLSQQATLESLSLYVAAASGKMRLGLYDAAGPGGGPGALKAQTNEITPVTGWNTASVSPVTLTPGTYWLAVLFSDNNLHFRTSSTGTVKYYSYAYGALPTAFSISPSTLTGYASFYATLRTSGTDSTSPAAPSGLSVQ